MVDERHLVAQSLGLFHEVSDKQDRDSAVAHTLDQFPRLAPSLRIKTRRQFIQDCYLGLADECEDDGQPLFLPAGEIAVIRVPLLVESKYFEKMVALCGLPIEGCVQFYGFADSNLRLQGAFLKLHANLLVQLTALHLWIEAEDFNVSAIWCSQARETLDRRRFTRAVSPKDAKNFASSDRETDVIHRRSCSIGLVKVLDTDDYRGFLGPGPT